MHDRFLDWETMRVIRTFQAQQHVLQWAAAAQPARDPAPWGAFARVSCGWIRLH